MTLFESHGLANRPGEPYPATFRKIQWTHWESNPDFRPADPVSSLGTMSPQLERRGIEPEIAWVQTRRLPVGPTPRQFSAQRSVRELNSVLV